MFKVLFGCFYSRCWRAHYATFTWIYTYRCTRSYYFLIHLQSAENASKETQGKIMKTMNKITISYALLSLTKKKRRLDVRGRQKRTVSWEENAFFSATCDYCCCFCMLNVIQFEVDKKKKLLSDGTTVFTAWEICTNKTVFNKWKLTILTTTIIHRKKNHHQNNVIRIQMQADIQWIQFFFMNADALL